MATSENDGVVHDTIDPIRERSRPVKISPPKFSDNIPSEMAHFAREVAEAINTESTKAYHQRREMDRVEQLSKAVWTCVEKADHWTQATKDMIGANAKTSEQLARLSESSSAMLEQVRSLASKLDRLDKDMRTLERKAYDSENEITLLRADHDSLTRDKQAKHAALNATIAEQDSRIKALEHAKLIAAAEEVGKQKLITKGRVFGGVAYAVGVAIAAKWSWIVSLFK